MRNIGKQALVALMLGLSLLGCEQTKQAKGPKERPVTFSREEVAAHSVALREAASKVRNELVPLLKEIPEDIKRTEQLIETNERLLRQLEAMK